MTGKSDLRTKLLLPQGFAPVQELQPIWRSSTGVFENIGSGAVLITSMQTQSLPALALEQTESTQQALPQFSDQFLSTVAVFPNIGRVVENEYGVFVPRSIFGADANLAIKEEKASSGVFRVTIFALLQQQQLSAPTTNCLEQVRWLHNHQHEFRGEWVALDGTHLVAHAKHAREVFEVARNVGVKIPFVVRVPAEDEELPFAGW